MSEQHTAETRTDDWRSHIEAWEATGLSQMGYCRANDLSYSQFIYWRRKLRPPEQSSPAQGPGGFVPVTHALPAMSQEGLTVALPNGVELRGITADNLVLAKQLLSRWS